MGINGGGFVCLKIKMFWFYDKISGFFDDFSYLVVVDVLGLIWLVNCDGGVVWICDGVVDFVFKCVVWCVFSVKFVFFVLDGSVWIVMGIGVYCMWVNNFDVVDWIYLFVYVCIVWVMFVV